MDAALSIIIDLEKRMQVILTEGLALHCKCHSLIVNVQLILVKFN